VRILALLRRPFSSDPVMLKDVLETPSGAGAETASKRYPLLLVTGIGLTIAYVALLSTLGFFIGTALYIATLIRTGRYRRWPVIAVVALGGALAFMFVFMRIVYLSLPIGVPPFAQVSLMLMQLMGIR
jgi:putative tricarboxylic transport membrane protein